MKYLKLFEQFEDEEDVWWERPDPYVEKLLIFNYIMPGIRGKIKTDYYLGTLDGDTIIIFENHPSRSYNLNNGWKICEKTEMFADSKIIIYDSENKYNQGYIRNNNPWKTFYFENLPKEIKDRII